jgi:uncharacterized membrane protein HdeD (DUF308 family)
MRTLRYIAALLLILDGALHAMSYLQAPQDPNALPMLVFGIIYFTAGILLFLDMKYSAVMGIVFPLTGLAAGVFVIGLNNDKMLWAMFAIDVLVVICCCILYFRKTKLTRAG